MSTAKSGTWKICSQEWTHPKRPKQPVTWQNADTNYQNLHRNSQAIHFWGRMSLDWRTYRYISEATARDRVWSTRINNQNYIPLRTAIKIYWSWGKCAETFFWKWSTTYQLISIKTDWYWFSVNWVENWYK